MDAKKYLEQIGKNECIIANKQIEKKYWLDMAKGTTATVTGERVQTSGDGQSKANQIVEAVMIDAEIERLKGEIAEIISTMQKLKKNEYNFLHKMYVQHLSLKEVQVEMKKTYSGAKSMHSRALRNLQRILNENVKC